MWRVVLVVRDTCCPIPLSTRARGVKNLADAWGDALLVLVSGLAETATNRSLCGGNRKQRRAVASDAWIARLNRARRRLEVDALEGWVTTLDRVLLDREVRWHIGNATPTGVSRRPPDGRSDGG